MRNSDRFENKSFKNPKDVSERVCRRQNEYSVNIRNAKRDDLIVAKRKIATKDSNEPYLEGKFQTNVQYVNSNIIEKQLDGVVYFRKLVSSEKNPPIDDIIKVGLVQRFLDFLVSPQGEFKTEYGQEEMNNMYLELQFESCWVLTNIASGTSEQTMEIVNRNGISIFKNLLLASHNKVKEQAIWALGNISGDGKACRNLVLNEGIPDIVAEIIAQETGREDFVFLGNTTWALFNMYRGESLIDLDTVCKVLPMICGVLDYPNTEAAKNICQFISYISDGSEGYIDHIIDSGAVERLKKFLNAGDPHVIKHALRIIGNIVAGNDEQTQFIINSGFLGHLKALMRHTKNYIVKETCWIVSNITAGTKGQIQCVIDVGIIEILYDVMKDADLDVKKEVCWIVSNAVSSSYADDNQISFIVNNKGLDILCELLLYSDNKILMVALDGILYILKNGDKIRNDYQENPYSIILEEIDGRGTIECLQGHGNKEVRAKSEEILNHYFARDEVISDDHHAKINESTGRFHFLNQNTNLNNGFNF